jgi:Ca2+/Na+ antiporter
MNKIRINKEKIMKAIITSLLFMYLFATLITSQAIYKPFLMVFTLVLMVWALYHIVKSEEMESRNLRRWRKARERGVRVNVVIGSLRIFVYAVVLFVLGRMVDGVTLIELSQTWLRSERIPIVAIIFGISVLAGFLSWRKMRRNTRNILKEKMEEENDEKSSGVIYSCNI